MCVRECQNERVKERKSVGRADGNGEMESEVTNASSRTTA